MSTADVLPVIFHKKWTKPVGNIKNLNKYSEHDNYNLIQNYGEYLDAGFGKRYFEDKVHRSNSIFYKEGPFTKREELTALVNNSRNVESAPQYSNHHHRYHKKRHVKINSIKDDNQKSNIEFYLKQKQTQMPPNSLNFDGEIFVQNTTSNNNNNNNKIASKNLISSEPYRKHFIHPWRYSFKTVDYQTCSEAFRRVKSCCIDLSKY